MIGPLMGQTYHRKPDKRLAGYECSHDIRLMAKTVTIVHECHGNGTIDDLGKKCLSLSRTET